MSELGFEALTPTTLLDRAARAFPENRAVIEGSTVFTYAELASRCRQLAGMLMDVGVRAGDRVAVLAPNTHMLLEAHTGVPWAGGVLVAMNTRLSPAELTYIVEHSRAKVLLYDASLAEKAGEVIDELSRDLLAIEAGPIGSDYESRLATAPERSVPVTDERGLLSINYTSGTTGRPKGVEYHHRGAYLQALAMAFHSRLGADSRFLWTLPMFHCNGWCFPWAVSAAAATHICLDSVEPQRIWHHIENDGVTHFNGAPTVLTLVADHPDARPAPQSVRAGTGGAPPSPTILARMSALNIEVTHLYGLTETFGPSMLCDWHPEWDGLPADEQAALKARQGVGNVITGGVRVIDDRGGDVPADGTTMGEVAIRGNNVMRGYHRDPEATEAVASDGWFCTGDLGVMHPDGYVELRDRSKDIIISGGENIATIEIEQAMASHPAVSEVAVVGAPDERWGEIPVAHVALRSDGGVSERELVDHVKARLANFKAPKHVVFGALPKTSTGKIQKFALRAAHAEEK